jgi:transposase
MLDKEQVLEIAEEIAQQVIIKFTAVKELSEYEVAILKKHIIFETVFSFTGDVKL